MKNKISTLAVAGAFSLAVLGASSAQVCASGFPISTEGSWQFTEDSDYSYAKGSASHMLSTQEAVLHHSLFIKINRSMIDQFTFKVGCMVQNPTPLFELRVNSLDIRLFDSVNDFVYARMMVDDNQEYSLRGEIAGRNRIIFAPITKAQERGLSDLFLQMREGGKMKIGLLQGENGQVRVYEIPLAGFIDYSDKILQSCQAYNQYFKGEQQYLPDYMAKEPEGYAPKDYSLKQADDVIDPNAPVAAPEPEPVVEEVEVVKHDVKPEVLPFAPGGGPASIGPDGMPIGAVGSTVGASSGQAVDKSFGTAQGPMQIGPDGMPVAAGTPQANAPAAPTVPAAPDQAPAAAPVQQPAAAAPAPAEGNDTEEEGGFFDIF